MNKIWKLIPKKRNSGNGKGNARKADSATTGNPIGEPNELFDLYMKGEASREEKEFAEELAKSFWTSMPDAEDTEASPEELHGIATAERKRLADTLGIRMPEEARRWSLKKTLRYVSAAAMIAMVMGTGVYFLYSHLQERGRSECLAKAGDRVSYSTGGVIQNIRTEDGSLICLNAHTRLEYDRKDFNVSERRVEMPEGEAYFRIAKNRRKPFFIGLGRHTVEVVGTSFNISRYNELNKCVISVVSGLVRVLDGQGKEIALLPKNREITLGLADGRFTIQEKDCQKTIGWTDGGLVLNDAGMDELKMRVEQKFGVKVRMPSELARKEVRLRASFGKDATLEEVMQSLKLLYGIRYRTDGSCVTLYGSE